LCLDVVKLFAPSAIRRNQDVGYRCCFRTWEVKGIKTLKFYRNEIKSYWNRSTYFIYCSCIGIR
jgi:hypothetical protein